MPRAKREVAAVEDEADEQLDEQPQADTVSGAIPEGELALARQVAKRLGWKPIEEWTRDPDKFVDAPEFLEETPRILAELKERSERTAQAAAAAIEEERKRKVEEATRVIRESDDPAEREKAAAKLRDNAGPPPETQVWLSKNPWFHTDPDAQALVISTVNRLAQQGVPIGTQLEEAEKKVRQRFPEYFANGTEQRLSDVRRQAPIAPQVHNGSRAASSQQPREKGFADIPKADREAFNGHLLKAFMSNGQTKEQAEGRYARSYWNAPPPDPSERGDEYPLKPQSNVWAKRRGTTRV
jgi:hypothetical protein